MDRLHNSLMTLFVLSGLLIAGAQIKAAEPVASFLETLESTDPSIGPFLTQLYDVNTGPVITSPGDQNNSEGDTVSLQILASDSDGHALNYGATGLPPQLTIDTSSGLISGDLAAGSAGNYSVTISVTDGLESDSTAINWTVTAPPAGNTMETITVSGVNSSAWTTVTLNNNYNGLVVVCSGVYANNTIPFVVRMRNAAGNSFQIRLQNPSNNALSSETVHCIAMEEGIWTLPDGRSIEAYRVNSTFTDSKSSWEAAPQISLNSYVQPVVLGQVMTYNDPAWSVFWSRGTSRTNPASDFNLYIGKHVAEDTNTARADELLGVIILEQGTGAIAGTPYEAALGPDTITGFSNPRARYSYTQTYSGNPQFAVGIQTAMDGNNGGWAMLSGNNALNATGLQLFIDEDQIRDNERSHVNEQVMYIIFESNVNVQLTSGLPGF